MPDDDEDLERRRQQLELEQRATIDQLYVNPPRVSQSGLPDGRSAPGRRKGRVINVPLRVHPRVNAILRLILKNGPPDTVPDLFVDMLDSYLKIRTDVNQSSVLSDAELIRLYLAEQEKKDGI